jgi:hypothetical protein
MIRDILALLLMFLIYAAVTDPEGLAKHYAVPFMKAYYAGMSDGK